MNFLRTLTLLCLSVGMAGLKRVEPQDSEHQPGSSFLKSGYYQEHLASYLMNEIDEFKHWAENDCYPWMYHNKTSGVCECSDIPYRAVLCDPTIPRTYILDCYCMTYNEEQNETELGRCLSGCGHKTDNVHYELPQSISDLNAYSCGASNRDSPLCGKCESGYSPLVYSYEMTCMNCTGMTYNWIKYIAVAYIPLTFFFFFVVIVGFNGTSPLVRGFISVCQGLVSPINMRAYLAVVENKSSYKPYIRAFGFIYGIWNLDFFRTVLPSICMNISPLQALVLDYAIAFYPLFLVILTVVLIRLHSRGVYIIVKLWKPFHKLFHLFKQDWSQLEGSVFKAFATFFLLSYFKVLNVTADLLVCSEKYTLPLGEQSYSVEYVLYYDASIEYFRGEHLYYGIAAIFVGVFVVIFPLVFLVIYPMHWFQKCLNRLKVQRQSIDTFVNCYQGHYKDGTNGTRDWRFFSIQFFLVQIIFVAIFVYSKSIYYYPVGAIFISIFIFIILAIQPYKKQFKVYTLIDSFMLLIMDIIYILVIAADEANIKAPYFSKPTHFILAILVMVPLLYVVILTIWWIFMKRKLQLRLPCFQKSSSHVQLEQSCADEDFPDRMINPNAYQAQAAPLLSDHQRVYQYNSTRSTS